MTLIKIFLLVIGLSIPFMLGEKYFYVVTKVPRWPRSNGSPCIYRRNAWNIIHIFSGTVYEVLVKFETNLKIYTYTIRYCLATGKWKSVWRINYKLFSIFSEIVTVTCLRHSCFALNIRVKYWDFRPLDRLVTVLMKFRNILCFYNIDAIVFSWYVIKYFRKCIWKVLLMILSLSNRCTCY